MNAPDDNSPDRHLAIGGATVLVASVAVIAFIGGVTPSVRVFQLAYAVAFIGYVMIVWAIARGGGTLPGRWPMWLCAAMALRLMLLATTPSDDLYRYVWEGRVQAAGFNPYSLAPDDARLAALRDDVWLHVTHRDYPAIYPPLAQIEFRLLAAAGAPLRIFKIVHVVWDCLTVLVLAAWLRSMGRAPHAALVYALNPLVLTAFAVEGHVDSLMLLCLALCAWCVSRNAWKWAALALGGAILTKVIPIVLLPWLVWRRRWIAVLICLAVVAAGCAAYASAGLATIDGLRRFAGTTAFLGAAFPLLDALAGPYARALAVVAVVVIIGIGLIRHDDFPRYAFRSLAAVVVFSPIVHYWYLAVLILFLTFTIRPSWLLLSGSMLFYFAAEQVRLTTGTWSMPNYVPWAVYVPFTILWLAESRWRRRRVARASCP